MRKLYILIFSLLTSCEPPYPSNQPKKADEGLLVKFNLPGEITTSSSDWSYTSPVTFTIDYTRQIDSIIFIPSLRSQSIEEQCIAELYNFTQNKVVEGSTIISQINYVMHSVRSKDLFQSIDQEIESVGIRFRSAKENNFVGIGPSNSVIIYYRK